MTSNWPLLQSLCAQIHELYYQMWAPLYCGVLWKLPHKGCSSVCHLSNNPFIAMHSHTECAVSRDSTPRHSFVSLDRSKKVRLPPSIPPNARNENSFATNLCTPLSNRHRHNGRRRERRYIQRRRSRRQRPQLNGSWLLHRIRHGIGHPLRHAR